MINLFAKIVKKNLYQRKKTLVQQGFLIKFLTIKQVQIQYMNIKNLFKGSDIGFTVTFEHT